ncbi:MAG: hypothetical protein JXR94_21710 [Candidatus Hydrogenedentes bacterium]|nr:hypothetical protein [Candidatus Hydrogenedentota bacterium]
MMRAHRVLPPLAIALALVVAGAASADPGAPRGATMSAGARGSTVRVTASSARPYVSQSPFANVHHGNDAPVYRHPSTHAEIHVQPGQSYAAFGTGFVVTGGRPQPRPRRVWIEGHYEWRQRRIWVPDCWEDVYVPPVYGVRIVNGRRVDIVLAPGHYERRLVPGHYDVVSERIWIPGYWRTCW